MQRWQLVHISVLGLAVWCWALTAPALSRGRGQGFRPSPYVPYSCPVGDVCRPFDDSGKVVRVFSESLADAMEPGMALLLDTKNRGQVHISLGPVWYLERQAFELKPGDEVQARGMSEEEQGGNSGSLPFNS